MILGLAFFACKSDAERQDQARQKAQSWIATSEMVVAQWKANRVPTAYAHHTLREARDKLRSLHRPDAARWADSLDKSLP